MNTDESSSGFTVKENAEFILYLTVAKGAAVRVLLSLDYSKWLAVGTGAALAFALNQWGAMLLVIPQVLSLLGAIAAVVSLYLAASVYGLSMHVVPLDKIVDVAPSIVEKYGFPDPKSYIEAQEALLASLKESGFRAKLFDATLAKNFIEAARLSNQEAIRIESYAAWQFKMTILAVVLLAAAAIIQKHGCLSSSLAVLPV